MGFWWFMLLNILLIPAVMLGAGWYMWRRPPKKINALYGYRTTRSMKNMDTWNFAHAYAGKLWWKLGWILLVPSVLAHLSFYGGTEAAVGWESAMVIGIQCVVMLGSIFPVERALKRTFTEDGAYRQPEG